MTCFSVVATSLFAMRCCQEAVLFKVLEPNQGPLLNQLHGLVEIFRMVLEIQQHVLHTPELDVLVLVVFRITERDRTTA